MDAVTYPDERVIEFISQHIVPMRVHIGSEPLPQRFNVQWTPTFVLLNADGQEQHRTVGWHSPEELLASLLVGIAKSSLNAGDLAHAASTLERVLNDYPEADAAPEAQYLHGVVKYKVTDDLNALKEMQALLRANYPSSEWTKRASVYQSV